MRISLSKILALLILALVFEETVYGWLRLQGTYYTIAKIWTELLLYGLVILLVMYRSANQNIPTYKLTKFDVYLALFLILSIVSIYINNGDLYQGVLNTRTMLRYVSAYYIVMLAFGVDFSEKGMRFVKFVIFIALIQTFLAAVQSIAGDAFTDKYFGAVRTGDETISILEVITGGGGKLGAAIGTFGKSAIMSMFLLLASVFSFVIAIEKTKKERLKMLIAYVVILFGIYLTYKRSTLIFALFVPFMVTWMRGYKKLTLKTSIISIPFILLFASYLIYSSDDVQYESAKNNEMSSMESIQQLFTSEYWAVTNKKARGWILFEVGGEALSSFKPLGYGPDVENAQHQLAEVGGEFSKLVGWGALDDVYVVATLVYFGPIGLMLILLCFIFIYKRALLLRQSMVQSERILSLSLRVSLILTFFASFVVRTLEFRAFSLCFWILCGLVVSISYFKSNHSNSTV